MKVYLASPFFDDVEREAMTSVLNKMRSEGHEVYAPYEHEQEGAWEMDNKTWGLKVFQEDINAIQECDEVWVINHGMYSDSGTAWECGYAYGIGKTVRQLLCSDNQSDNTFSLMMINGCDEYDAIGLYLANEPCGFDIDDLIEQK